MSYLKDGVLLEDKEEARKLRVRAARFILLDELLYKRGFSQPYLRCLTQDESLYVLKDVHEGAYGNHLGARSLVHKIVHTGYYWPSTQVDAKAYVKACDKFQLYSNIRRQSFEYLTPMVAPWPFAQWGFDILGLFLMGKRQMKFLVVGIGPFRKFCEQLGIRNHYSSPSHPEANGQAKVTKRSLLKIIKTWFEGVKGIWLNELPSVL